MHRSVLLKESIEALDLEAGETFVDGTFGGGGHSREARRLYPEVRIIALDQDPEVAEREKEFKVTTLNFRDIDKLGVRADAILLDIGLSSIQLDGSNRGFSFQRDEPLDMRMSKSGVTAAEILNTWDEEALELILRGFGEERFSARIAKEIVRTRDLRPFKTTADLVETIESIVPAYYRRGKIHPATRTFQALRIAVNEELTALEMGLGKSFEMLNPKGRLAVITFHSLEDRVVKNFFRDKAKAGEATLITKKPMVPSTEEIQDNPRSRSAKLRTIEKL